MALGQILRGLDLELGHSLAAPGDLLRESSRMKIPETTINKCWRLLSVNHASIDYFNIVRQSYTCKAIKCVERRTIINICV